MAKIARGADPGDGEGMNLSISVRDPEGGRSPLRRWNAEVRRELGDVRPDRS